MAQSLRAALRQADREDAERAAEVARRAAAAAANQSALYLAAQRLRSMPQRVADAQRKAGAMVEVLAHSAEMQATVLVASVAEGYLGEEKMGMGHVDYRAVAGLVCGAVSLVRMLDGCSVAPHGLAVSNGLLAAAGASFGHRAGQRMAADKAAESAQPAATPPAADPAPAPQLAGDTILTPDPAVAGDAATARRIRFLVLNNRA